MEDIQGQQSQKDKENSQQKNHPANNKLAVFLAFHISVQQQMVGMGSIIAYSGEIVGSIMPAFEKLFPIFMNIVAVVGCFGAIPIVKFLGRKGSLSYGALAISIVLVILGYALSEFNFDEMTKNSPSRSYFVMFLFVSIRMLFSLSLGPIAMLFISETVQANIIAIATMANWWTVAVLNIIFPILTQLFNGNPSSIYYFFSIYTFLGFLINKKCLIETAGKTQY